MRRILVWCLLDFNNQLEHVSQNWPKSFNATEFSASDLILSIFSTLIN